MRDPDTVFNKIVELFGIDTRYRDEFVIAWRHDVDWTFTDRTSNLVFRFVNHEGAHRRRLITDPDSLSLSTEWHVAQLEVNTSISVGTAHG